MAAYLMLEGLGMIRGWLRNLHAALMRDNSVRAWQPLRQFFRPGEGFPLPGDSGSIGICPGSVRSVTATCGSGRYQGQARNIS
jgi:hypothetical protein